MSNSNKTPAIRFKGFTDTWEQRKLGDEAIEILAGGDIDKSKTVENGKYPIYANALTNDGVVGYYDDYYRVKAPAVTVTGRGEVGFAQARMVDFTPVVRLLAIRSNHDCYFLENAINNHKVVVESTGVPQLTVPQLSSYNIFFPKNVEEETRIGEFLHNLDSLITFHQRKYDKLIRFKAAMLQKMFPQNGADKPEIRFRGFTDTWEQRELGDISDVTKLAGFEFTEHIVYSDKGSIIALRGLNVKNGQLVLDDVKYIDGSNFSKLSRSKLYVNDVLFTYVGTVGELAIIPENERFYLAPNVSRIRFISDYDAQFMIQEMGSKSFYDNMIFPLIATSSQPALSMENIRKFVITVPKNNIEQHKIGSFFSRLDTLITLHQRKRDKYKSIKAGLIRKLFPME